MYGACIYDAANFVTNGRTDEQGDSRSRMSLAHIWTAIAVDASTIGHVGILDLHLRRRSQLPELSGEGGEEEEEKIQIFLQ